MLYHVSDEQLADAGWLKRDDDGDGISNGDELIAGTNPFDRNSKFTLEVNSSGGITHYTFPTLKGKVYTVQSTATLSMNTPWQSSQQMMGTGLVSTVTSSLATGPLFYRINVTDTDTTGNGVSDWAKLVLGYDPSVTNTHGALMDDHTAITAALALENTITITATGTTATQPVDASTPAASFGTFVVNRGGTLLFSTVTVPLVKTGTAFEGTDYAAMPASVTFAPNTSSIALSLTPLANPARKVAATAILVPQAGAGYKLGTPSSAAVAIYPANPPAGTGLTGRYYSTTTAALAATYNASTLFDSANLKLTRLDPVIDFLWNGVAPSSAVPVNVFTVRWSGQVLPEFSETYYFVAKTDDGVKVWVNGQLIIDQWINHSVRENIGSIDLQAGVFYDVKMEYYQAKDTKDEAHLSWYSESQVKQIIPSARLYPDTLAPVAPAIISPIATQAFTGQTISYQVAASNSANTPVVYSLGSTSTPLPAGLALNSATGLITGTTTTAGTFQVAINATASTGSSSSVLSLEVLSAGNAVSRELWTNLSGSAVANLPLTQTPSSTDTALKTLEDATSYANNTGERLRGYLTAPKSGNYYFWLAASSEAEFWLSDDDEPVKKILRAKVTSSGTAKQEWSNSSQTAQKSAWLALVAGQNYYYEVLRNTSNKGTDYVSVGWQQDDTGTAAPLANGTGVIPGYVLTKYDYPAGGDVSGVLYATNLAPQGTAASRGVGSASLRLNSAKTQAVLHFDYSSLTSPFIAAHIHADPSTLIIFDIDDADKFHPDLKTSDGGYIWNLSPVGSFSTADIVNLIETGKTYLNVHTSNYPSGEIRGNLGLVKGSPLAPVLQTDPGFPDDHSTDAAAARFLTQATFGPSQADINNVKSLGYSAWIDQQFTLTASHMLPIVQASLNPNIFVGQQPYAKDKGWWQVSITAPDQLRQRMAFALSEIIVIAAGSNSPIGNSNYYDTLVDNAFGNFGDLLTQVSLDPTMGDFLNMRGNDKGDLSLGRHANENYAREIMQLFSIGLNRLWPDGSFILDSKGRLIPTYDQNVILGMAKIFTGWQYAQVVAAGARLPTNFSPPSNYVDAMTLVPTHHDLGTKRLLNNVMLPAAGVTDPATPLTYSNATSPYNGMNAYDVNGLLDLDRAIASLVNHPNVGPYLCRQLIQRFVTGNPSPAYVYRVVAKFNDDGTAQHARGNLKAVLKAILMDGEARHTGNALAATGYGKQREPLLRMTALARSFPAAELSGTYSQTADDTITITTATPHFLAVGSSTALDFSANTTGTPAAEFWYNPGPGIYGIVSTPTPNSFTILPQGLTKSTYSQPANSRTLTVNMDGGGNTKQVYTGKTYLNFLSGGAPDGVYTLTANPAIPNTFTVTTPDTPTAARSGDVIRPNYTINLDFYNIGTATASSIITTASYHNLRVNDHLWVQLFLLPGGQAGEFIVTQILTPQSVKIVPVDLTNAAGFKNGRVGYGGNGYPLVTAPIQRSGSVNVSRSNYTMENVNGTLLETALEAPSVFNFYYPDYKYPGTLASNNITTPEFQLTTDTSIVNLTNTFTTTFLNSGASAGLVAYTNNRTYTGGKIYLNLSPYIQAPYSVADATGISSLVNTLDTLMGAQLTASAKAIIVSFVSNPAYVAATVPLDRVREIVHLISVSPEYSIQR